MNDRAHGPRMLTAYRSTITPSSDDEARAWARLEAVDGAVAPSRSNAPRRTAWIAAAAFAAAAGLAVFFASGREQDAVEAVGGHEQSVHGIDPVDASEVTHDVAPSLPPAELPIASTRPEPPEPTIRRPRAAVIDPLRAELELIRAARAALDRGDLDGALAGVGDHRRRFVDGVLVIEARAIGAVARCRRGPIAAGRGEARVLLGEPGAAAYRDLLRDACDLQ